MSILNGKIPNSPYIIADGVDVFKLKIYLLNFNSTLSNMSQFPNPHISLPYKRTGLTSSVFGLELVNNKWHSFF